jgi:hypothetical protein
MRQYSTHARLTDPQVSCAFLKFHAFTDLNIHCTAGCFNGNKQSRTTEHGLIISVQKTKLMAIKGRDPVRNKTITDNKIIEKANSCKYLGNLISCEKDMDIGNKLNDYVEIKCQLDATDEFFIADLIACSTCFGHLYAHHQEF